MRTANPALNSKTFQGFGIDVAGREEAMTLDGTVNKTAILLLLLLVSSFWVWRMFFQTGNPVVVMPWILVGLIGGLVCAVVTAFKKEWASGTAPMYAILEGLLLGGLSAFMEAQYPGIVIQAVALTFGTLSGLLLAYKTGWIQATENFKLGVAAATFAIFLFYIVSMVLGLFGIRIAMIHETGLLGIGFSVFVVIIAALNLVLDFDFIEQGAKSGAPKYMEWYAAFGLMVTLVWLYVEILRLLSRLRKR